MNNKCPFCEPNILESAFLESDNFLAISNTSPILAGHSLIIPKRHILSFLDLSEKELSEFIFLGQKTAKILSDYFKSGSFNLSIQDGFWAGQTIFHLHMHIIPRIQNDLKSPGEWYHELEKTAYTTEIDSSIRPKLSKEDFLKNVQDLKNFINKLI
ncbi:MAG: HIT domain-containing protein [Candidatus Sericytochromatia bacterium]|nr:HIT domain-containing protein [Candidatus Sericytochromatia bacterium]